MKKKEIQNSGYMILYETTYNTWVPLTSLNKCVTFLDKNDAERYLEYWKKRKNHKLRSFVKMCELNND